MNNSGSMSNCKSRLNSGIKINKPIRAQSSKIQKRVEYSQKQRQIEPLFSKDTPINNINVSGGLEMI